MVRLANGAVRLETAGDLSLMTYRDEWIAERVALILEGNSFPLGPGRWGCNVTEKQAFDRAAREYNEWWSRDTSTTNESPCTK